MADGYGLGGNVRATCGEMPLTASPEIIPLPGGTFGASRLTITAPSSEDMYIGPIGQVVHRIPANTSQWFAVREQLYAAASPSDQPSVSSSSSSSSISAVNSFTWFYEWNP